MGILDEIAPSYMGEQRIGLSLDLDLSPSPKALDIVSVRVDLSRTLPQGIVFPIEMVVKAPSESNDQLRYFRRVLPGVVSFRVFEGGRHTLTLSEVGHDRWYGTLTFDVQGDVTG